ncbi:haloacid dehalogenase type II [Caballeronia sp. LZ062]|uniref:haloacid dehalogenase type II n=1 Tax=unclassified Caballeronia TaxID=2646786 RepID=UPI002856D229|nr:MULTISPECIES: haloacid dehalogenase type II [unclassified Caballeronia]MDR5857101.1 haloacid dehalogenase type II [Caballeronia sp. LZ050]MDR5869503.1 haloacid dehalogenase type II [Caballeronia sp. LZ062]
MPLANNRERILVFDVNETLLDIEALEPFFARTFSGGCSMRRWFDQQILYSQALTLSGRYVDFGTLAVAVLKMLAQTCDVHVRDDDIDEFTATLKALPPHADVAPALDKLAGAGFRMVSLSNSPKESSEGALSQAGIRHYFDEVLSVDPLHQFKPALAVYTETARGLGADPARLRLIAAHVWDTTGAQAAGWAAALVTRRGNAPLPWGEQPDIIEPSLLAVADRIVACDS